MLSSLTSLRDETEALVAVGRELAGFVAPVRAVVELASGFLSAGEPILVRGLWLGETAAAAAVGVTELREGDFAVAVAAVVVGRVVVEAARVLDAAGVVLGRVDDALVLVLVVLVVGFATVTEGLGRVPDDTIDRGRAEGPVVVRRVGVGAVVVVVASLSFSADLGAAAGVGTGVVGEAAGFGIAAAGLAAGLAAGFAAELLFGLGEPNAPLLRTCRSAACRVST